LTKEEGTKVFISYKYWGKSASNSRCYLLRLLREKQKCLCPYLLRLVYIMA